MTQNQISRRNFLKTAGIATAAIGVTVCGGTALAVTYQPPIEKPTIISKEGEMSDRILLAYATKAGSTAEVAARIRETLTKRSLPLDVMPLESVRDLTPFRTVILGSAVRVGKVLPVAQNFVEQHQAALTQKTFHIFIVCMTMAEDTPDKRQRASAILDPVRAVIKPIQEGMFAGKVDYKKLKLLDSMMAKAVKVPEGDFRNWDQINAWAESLVI